MSSANNYLKIYENTFVKGNMDILGDIDIQNDLFTNNIDSSTTFNENGKD